VVVYLSNTPRRRSFAEANMFTLQRSLLFLWVFLATLAAAQTTKGNGYVGYDLDLEGDESSVIFSTDETRPNAGAKYPDPDVYLNASGKQIRQCKSPQPTHPNIDVF